MNRADRIFWGGVFFISVHLIWLAGVEKIIPLAVGTIIGIAAFLIVFLFGPGAKEAGADKTEEK